MLPVDFETHPEVASPLSALELGRASVTYALGGLAYKGVALLSVPLLARLLSPAELGLLDLAAVLASTVGLAVSVGTDQSVAYLEPRSARPSALWGSALWMIVAGGTAAVVLALLFRTPLALLLTQRAEHGEVIAAAALYGAVMALSGFALVTIRLRSTPRRYAVASFLIVTAEMAAALAVAALVDEPLPLVIMAWAAGAALVAVPLLLRHMPRLERPNTSDLRRLGAFGLPLIPAGIAWLIGDAWIRSTLARGSDLAALGEYGIAFRIASLLGLVVTGLGVAWYPYIHRSPPTEVGERAVRMFAVVIGALGGGAVAVTALAPEIIEVVAGAPYAGARLAVGALAAGMIAMGCFVLLAGVIGSTGSTARVAVAAVLGALSQGVVALLLVPGAGLAGAGIASLAGYSIALAAAGIAARRIIPGRGLISTLGTAVVVAGALALAQSLQDATVAVRIGIAVVAVGAAMMYVARSRPPDRPARSMHQ